MKKKWNLNKILTFALMIILISCGSDNEVTQIGDDSGNNSNPNSNTLVGGLEELRVFITNKNFPEQTSYYYSDFVYNEYETTMNCTGGFFRFCSYSNQTRVFDRSKEQYGSGYIVRHEFGSTFDDVKNGLLNIVNSAVAHQKDNNCLWRVRLSNGDEYGIDTCRSIVANPVFKRSNGNSYPKVTYEFIYQTP